MNKLVLGSKFVTHTQTNKIKTKNNRASFAGSAWFNIQWLLSSEWLMLGSLFYMSIICNICTKLGKSTRCLFGV